MVEPYAHCLGTWRKPRPDFRAGYPQIGDKPGLGTSVVNGRGFRLKVAEVHDVHMAISGESVCEVLGNVAWETKKFLRARRPIMVMSIYERGCVIYVPL